MSELSQDVDLCYHATENGLAQIDPIDASETVDDIPCRMANEIPLVFSESCVVSTGKWRFRITEEGFYRFCIHPDTIHNRILFKSDIPRFVGSVGCLHIHGWRDNHLSIADLLEKSTNRYISITCGFIRNVGISLFTDQGISARPVSTFTLEKWNTYNCGHALFEYLDPAENRWILADPDLNVVFRSANGLLDTVGLCERIRNRCNWKAVPVSISPLFDFCTDHLDDRTAFYAMSMYNLEYPRHRQRFFERVCQVPMIENCFTVDTVEQRSRFDALCATQGLSYQFLPVEEFRSKFYG